jgi:DNA-binding MarR family transcriptional regulator
MHFSLSPAAAGADAGTGTAEDAVMALMMGLGRRMRQRLPGDEIDFTALPLLKTLHHHGPMRLSSLAAELNLDASTVSRQARHLEDRGLLERTDDPDDGRASRVMVSAQGSTCLEKGASARRELVARVLDHWPDEDREQLRVLLNRLNDDLSSTHHHSTHDHSTHQENS